MKSKGLLFGFLGIALLVMGFVVYRVIFWPKAPTPTSLPDEANQVEDTVRQADSSIEVSLEKNHDYKKIDFLFIIMVLLLLPLVLLLQYFKLFKYFLLETKAKEKNPKISTLISFSVINVSVYDELSLQHQVLCQNFQMNAETSRSSSWE